MRQLSKLTKLFKPRGLDPAIDLPSKQVMTQIHKEISEGVTKGYHNKTLQSLYKSVPVRFLLDTAINFYVGSRSCPRNPFVVEMLFREAEECASNQLERLDVKYYQTYLKRLEAIRVGDERGFDEAAQSLYLLAEQHHPNALYMLGKELHKVAHNMLEKKQRKDRLEMLGRAVELLNKSIELGCFTALYTLGIMYEQGDIGNKLDFETAFNYFLISASFDNPYAFFKLSQYYKQGKVVPKNLNLYYRYLKKAAQLGVVEAQHNLASEYLNGTLIKKNQTKSLAWFLHAGQLGFSHSKYNAAMILLNGTQDGTLKPNIKASLVKFEEVQRQGDVDASQIIGKLSKLLADQKSGASKTPASDRASPSS